MSIGQDSRYKNQDVIAIESRDGTIKKFVTPRAGLSPRDVDSAFEIHRYATGERLQDISLLHYGRDDLWWFIAEVNGIVYPFDIAQASRLVIPSLDRALAQLAQ